jgi:hypothetical protein
MTAEELPDATGFSFDVPEGAKNVIYRYRVPGIIHSGKEVAIFRLAEAVVIDRPESL